MEVALSGPQMLSETPRRARPLPLRQLVEESRKTPRQLPDSKNFANPKCNSQIQAEPPELHFSGFQLNKQYQKTLKLINVSSEALNIHIVPTLTEYFQTTFTKKHRLIPGLAYTLKVAFCPDEWRYFYDCIHVRCEGEENLLIPVHAYPVIDDLHIPAHIDLSAVPLGQSVQRTIPLRCSCPVDFEFQVLVIQSHEAFSVQPLSGVISANQDSKITVTFSPRQYRTSSITFQLVVSQFNTKPYLCTVTGSSAPHLGPSVLQDQLSLKEAAPPEQKGLAPLKRNKPKSSKEANKLKRLGDQAGVRHGLTPPVDVCTPAGAAKMPIKDINKPSVKNPKKVGTSENVAAPQSRQVRGVKREEEEAQKKCQTRLGMDPMSEQTRKQILEEREAALDELTLRGGDAEDSAPGVTILSSERVLREAEQVPERSTPLPFHSPVPWELRLRLLRLFQQAARKIVIQCRMKRRLACLRKNLPSIQKAEESNKESFQIPPDKVFPLSFLVFSDEDDPLTFSNLAPEPVDAIDVIATTRIPLFQLQVPQHYKLMGYRPVSLWDAFHSYVPTTLARPLRSGSTTDVQREFTNSTEEEVPALSFRAPDALIRPRPVNPLRIFNPAPGLQAFKPVPKFLESDLEFYLCPLPRLPESNTNSFGVEASNRQKRFLNYKKELDKVMLWQNFDSKLLKGLSSQPALSSDGAPRRSIDYNADILLLAAPPPLPSLPDDLVPLTDTPCDGSGVQLTPEMIRAEFLSGKALVSNSNLTAGPTARNAVTAGSVTQRRPADLSSEE
ncbi:Cilia- and flagella-associated protein 221 [Oryzias melastigma]|uniref:Cilia- and flagella-associated protein 221 n=1 Tax=Oryzias melastigma TaxID=30732 RepID=A0A834FFI6_ORYME|nr:Cilia- and flagella-associated protein 221 [Oryzias melastigma]